MKPRQTQKEQDHQKISLRKNVNTDSKLDEIGIQRGQNGEKGNTVNPRNFRREKQASH